MESRVDRLVASSDQAPEPAAVCVVLPLLNEARNVRPLLEGIQAGFGARSHVVCIVDDGSRDETVALARAAAGELAMRVHVIERVKRHAGSQRGSALVAGMKWGLEHTTAQVFIEMDGDLSHRPEELVAGLDLVSTGQGDVAVASKYIPGSAVVNRPIGRRIVSRLCNALVRRLMSPRIRDYSNGYRFYSRRAAVLIDRTPIRYGSPIYLTEALGIWIASGLRVVEFPTTYIGRGVGESKLRIVDLAKASIAVFEIAWRLHIRGFRTRVPVGATGLPGRSEPVEP